MMMIIIIAQNCLIGRITATSRKTEPSIICILLYSILSSGRITGESKLCCFPKIRANILEHKQFKDIAFTGSISWCLSKSVKNKLDKQTVVNQDKCKKESSQIL